MTARKSPNKSKVTKSLTQICCRMMKSNLSLSCDQHNDKYECPDALIDQRPNGHFGIIIHDGGSSMIRIKYCPWCGSTLDKRDE